MGAVEKALVTTSTMSAAEEPRIVCIIHDTISNGPNITINLPISTTCRDLLHEVATKLSVQSASIDLHYEISRSTNEDAKQVLVNSVVDKTIGELCSNRHRNTFFVSSKDGSNLQHNTGMKNCSFPTHNDQLPAGAFSNTAAVSNTDNKDMYNSENYISNTAATNTIYNNSTSSYSYASALTKSDTGYVGLVNQAMTCYLNSLLQTLYMTPEFRNAVYRWEYDGSEEEAVKSIPYQLQRLFLLLQTSTKRAVETTDITKSFGWDSSEAWQQHDVQELCRVMFDALEKSWKNTDQADLITQLYQGKIKDYVKCLKCNSESARIDTYLDIPLVVRPYGAHVGYGSVEDALRAFIEPEILDGTNQYFCEKCNCKCDAHKGLKFSTFPYLLTLQLKRFDFDYSTMHRIKLNDRMSFPQRLGLGQFIDSDSEKTQLAAKEGAGDCMTCDTLPATSDCQTSPVDGEEGDDEGIDIADGTSGASSATGISKSDACEQPSCVYEYELFSIMVHSGGASGGHYYAYIRSFQDQQWYSFNDQHVYRIMDEDIEKTFGGSSYSTSYYSSYSSSANAYMLMYRQIDDRRNKRFMQVDEFPEHLHKQLQLLKNREEQEQAQRELERNMCKIKLYYWDNILRRYSESRLEVHKNKTLAEATVIAYQQLRLPGVLLANFRLVKFDSTHEYIDQSFDEWNTSIYQVLGGVRSVYAFDLLAETKSSDECFVPYQAGDFMVHVYPVNMATKRVEKPRTVRISPMKTVADLKELIAETFNIMPACAIRCVIERYYNVLRPLDVPARSLHTEGFQKTNKVYIEYPPSTTEQKMVFEKTAMHEVLDQYQNTIEISVHVPKMVPGPAMVVSRPESDTDAEKHNSMQFADDRSSEMDEGIGESETDVQSTADPAGADSTSLTSSAIVKEMLTDNTYDGHYMENSASGSSESQQLAHDGDVIVENMSCESNASFDSVRPVEPGGGSLFVDTSADDDESTMKVADDDSQGLSDISCGMTTSHSLSQDSGSSRTVEVGDDVRSPSPADDDDDNNESRVTPSSSPTTQSERFFEAGPPLTTLSGPSVEEVDSAKDSTDQKESNEDWDQELTDIRADDDQPTKVNRYFHVKHTVFPLGYERTLYVSVDKRITLKELKKSLEPYVGVTSEDFRVYKAGQGGQEVEETRLNDSLVNYANDSRVVIKYGRALKYGEQRVQVYQLTISDAEPIKYQVEVIVSKRMTIADVKAVIVEELRTNNIVEMPVNRCRLRRKSWKTPGHIYTNDSEQLEEGLNSPMSTELLFEVLNTDEPLPADRGCSRYSHISVYFRRWWPSKYEIDGLQEVVVEGDRIDDLYSALSGVSGISVEHLSIAKPKGAFPYDMSALEVEKELEWNPNVSTIGQWPLSINDDGVVIYYKDNTEVIMDLTDEQRKQLQQKENSRLQKHVSPLAYPAKKERALKIYTNDPPAAVAAAAVAAAASGTLATKPVQTLEFSPSPSSSSLD